MKVLIACEYSGTVRDAFIAAGHDAMSCDLLPTDKPGPHYQGDVFDVICSGDWYHHPQFDLMIAHPPCTYLTSAGLHWNKRRPERAQMTLDALEFVRRLMDCGIPKIALENPVGCISSQIRRPDQTIQPYQHGEDASKATCLWLDGLSPLVPTNRFFGRKVQHNGKLVERWSNQTDSGQNKLAPSADRWKLRSTTYAGIAAAMADQWGKQPIAKQETRAAEQAAVSFA